MTDLDLDAATAQIEAATELLTDGLLPVDIIGHPRLKAAAMGLGPSWAYVKSTPDVVEADRRRRRAAGVVTHVDGTLRPTDIEQVRCNHVCGPPASPWDVDRDQ